MDWTKLLEALVPPAIALAVGVYVGRLGLRAETMRLRHSIAERRLKDFDGAAGDLRRMMLEMGRQDSDTSAVRAARDRFLDTYPDAGTNMVLAAELAMMPEHRPALRPLVSDLLDSCRRLYSRLTEAQKLPGDVPEGPADNLVTRVTMLVHLLMEAVDVSAEAKLEGRSARRHTRRMAEVASRWAEEARSGNTPQPGRDP
jgi:hypothetical protein